MPDIHPLAAVDSEAELADDVFVGPFCVVGPQVTIGAGTRLLSHVSLTGATTVGKENVFFPFCSIGAEPQDLSYHGEVSRTEIGDRNTFRESCQVNRGTAKDKLVTRIGNDCLIMACCHIAHDCVLGDQVIMANNTLLGGHVKVESMVTFGGAVVVHHYVTIGKLAFVGGMTRVPKDVPPFMTLEGIPARVWMVNKVGCKRRGVSAESLLQLKKAHKLIFRSEMNWEEAFLEIEQQGEMCEEVRYLVSFCRNLNDSASKGRLRQPDAAK